jgi:hypothetical protein
VAPPTTPLQAKSDLQFLAITALALASIGLIAIVLPASVLEFEKIRATYPIADLYPTLSSRYFLVGSVAAMCFVFIAAVVIAGRVTGRDGARLALAGAALLGGVFVFAFPSGSLDIYHNIADARTLWLHGENPMRVPPIENTDSEIVRAVQAWRTTTSHYGPLTYVAYGPPVLVAGGGVAANLIAFKAYQALLLVLLTWLTGKAVAGLRPERQVQAMVIAGWNPYVLYEGVVNGHNDLLMAAVVIAGLWLTARRLLAGPVVVALSGAAKYIGGLATPLAAFWLWRNGTPQQRRWLQIGAALAILGGLVVAAFLFGDLERLHNFATIGGSGLHSPISVLASVLESAGVEDDLFVARTIAWVALAVAGLVCLLRLDRTPASLWRASFWLVFAAACLGPSIFWPWYLLWFVPLGAVLAGSREADLALAASATGLFTYAIFPWIDHSDTVNAAYVGFVFGVPLLYAFLAPVLRLPSTVERQPAIAAVVEPSPGS